MGSQIFAIWVPAQGEVALKAMAKQAMEPSRRVQEQRSQFWSSDSKTQAAEKMY
jgi:hypothetical protein